MRVVKQVRDAARLKLLFLPHALRQMSHPDRMISPGEVEQVVLEGVLVEEYPMDPRGPSCLLLGFGEGTRAVHVVCAPKEDYLAIITAYLPDPEQWTPDFMRRC